VVVAALAANAAGVLVAAITLIAFAVSGSSFMIQFLPSVIASNLPLPPASQPRMPGSSI
jgi:hypothetical protein